MTAVSDHIAATAALAATADAQVAALKATLDAITAAELAFYLMPKHRDIYPDAVAGRRGLAHYATSLLDYPGGLGSVRTVAQVHAAAWAGVS